MSKNAIWLIIGGIVLYFISQNESPFVFKKLTCTYPDGTIIPYPENVPCPYISQYGGNGTR